MPKPRRIALLAYEGCQLLDVTGPAAVFGAANEGRERPAYDVQIVSPDGGPVTSNCGVALVSRRFGGQYDTLLVVGGSRGLKAVMAREDVRRWLRRVAPRTRRFGSVCTGAFVLAAAGLLDGRRVATHWASCQRLADKFPALTVDADALYVVDGKVWTSAGVTTGIDMALALVEADLGAATANLIARHFVLYARRPGYQSQFSPLLQAQSEADVPFARLIDWMQAHLDEPLDVPTLAARAGLSERSFYRKFVEATGKTPAHFVEALRLDAARTLLAKGLPLKTIAGRVGLRSSARLCQAFERRFGMAPSLFREMHATG
ncbi:GlxA family transcriptional regulator [Reyranella sp.]|uniref:GlxA family transcriptional regulator n=1 Tax=Reyranella sp. TaxID=1929291 RepID=UPI0027278B19|nr:GlxA family transcriptional regulator [Reyranella sp.]MDO8975626.1 GlxA family transcriptional regulator [Reyranella sp.]MDP3238920.1 GlxA family transcriptional regulator [Reyranella sp.]